MLAEQQKEPKKLKAKHFSKKGPSLATFQARILG